MQPLTRAKRAAAKRNAATLEYRDAIRAAHEAGHSLREIAAAVGISHVRVLKIVRGD
jgi:hypothetical protein